MSEGPSTRRLLPKWRERRLLGWLLLLLPSLLMAGAVVSCKRPDRPDATTGDRPSRVATRVATRPTITTPTGFEMVSLPQGRFQMGSTEGEPDERPVHKVRIGAFLIDCYEMTQEQWAKLAPRSEWLAHDPSHFKDPKRPVEMVGWDQAVLFCNVRSRAEGLEPCYDEETGACRFEASGYRLPTEAEWEYAARAGSTSPYHFGSDRKSLRKYAWYAENASKKTHPVGRKKPNAWGLYDMHGNVAEWCNDRYAETYYQSTAEGNPVGPAEGEKNVLRGGAWNCSADVCRIARRVGEDPGVSDACFARDAIGFRCVRRISEKTEVQP